MEEYAGAMERRERLRENRIGGQDMGMEQEDIERCGCETVLGLYRRASQMILNSTPFEGFHYAAHALHTLSTGGWYHLAQGSVEHTVIPFSSLEELDVRLSAAGY